MIADLDGAQLRAYLATRAGRAPIRVGNDPLDLPTDRPNVVTSFSSGGLTAFGHRLKPDVGAPGGQILSSTLKSAGGPFAVFDGTSMAAPHVAGAAALLLERHPSWSPLQVKSALVSTAGTAWEDTARTVEARVLLSGSGIADVVAADDPKLFTDPVSLSYGDLNVTRGGTSGSLLLGLFDAGDGAGTWTIEVKPQSQPKGVAIEVPGSVDLTPGGEVRLPVTARAATDAEAGEAYGFLLLRRGDIVRKVPYALLVTRPRLANAPVIPLQFFQTGDTRKGVSRAAAYRYPAAAFGPRAELYGAAGQRGSAREKLYRIRIDDVVVNFGAAVVASSPGSLIHPWVLGSPDENDVQGYAGTPVNVNNLTIDYPLDVGAAASVFPRTKAYYVAVDSGVSPFTGRSQAGSYVLRAWVNDVEPPHMGLVTTQGVRRTAADRAAGARRRLGRRSVLARDLVSRRPDRRGCLRSGVGSRALPAAPDRASAREGPAAADRVGRGLPGGQERRLGRRGPAAEHDVRLRHASRRRWADRRLARSRDQGVCEPHGAARRDREFEHEDPLRPLPRREPPHFRDQARRGRALRRGVAQR